MKTIFLQFRLIPFQKYFFEMKHNVNRTRPLDGDSEFISK